MMKNLLYVCVSVIYLFVEFLTTPYVCVYVCRTVGESAGQPRAGRGAPHETPGNVC